MNTLERLKRKVVSRLTGEPDVTYLDKTIDGKVAIIRYKSREIIIHKNAGEFRLYHKKSEYQYWNSMMGYKTVKDAVEYARNYIKMEEDR